MEALSGFVALAPPLAEQPGGSGIPAWAHEDPGTDKPLPPPRGRTPGRGPLRSHAPLPRSAPLPAQTPLTAHVVGRGPLRPRTGRPGDGVTAVSPGSLWDYRWPHCSHAISGPPRAGPQRPPAHHMGGQRGLGWQRSGAWERSVGAERASAWSVASGWGQGLVRPRILVGPGRDARPSGLLCKWRLRVDTGSWSSLALGGPASQGPSVQTPDQGPWSGAVILPEERQLGCSGGCGPADTSSRALSPAGPPTEPPAPVTPRVSVLRFRRPCPSDPGAWDAPIPQPTSAPLPATPGCPVPPPPRGSPARPPPVSRPRSQQLSSQSQARKFSAFPQVTLPGATPPALLGADTALQAQVRTCSCPLQGSWSQETPVKAPGEAQLGPHTSPWLLWAPAPNPAAPTLSPPHLPAGHCPAGRGHTPIHTRPPRCGRAAPTGRNPAIALGPGSPSTAHPVHQRGRPSPPGTCFTLTHIPAAWLTPPPARRSPAICDEPEAVFSEPGRSLQSWPSDSRDGEP
ncbi:nascent polypeptide-associated complex subunit alpha, muscle-specific form-like [Ovis canadensis]|uniref:nascent polypeptide-associated complex subunit alpha, muscle-specific form-like n=1 Tax=Ovis canadensis TaxID=37174 RepID=UPI003753CBC3